MKISRRRKRLVDGAGKLIYLLMGTMAMFFDLRRRCSISKAMFLGIASDVCLTRVSSVALNIGRHSHLGVRRRDQIISPRILYEKDHLLHC